MSSYKIPLYNCYWCRCGWCLMRYECLDHCIKCVQRKKFKMPEYCENFVEDSSTNRRIKRLNDGCNKCVYKQMLQELQGKLADLLSNYTK